MLRQAIGDRMEQVGLRLHPDKTRIVYCRDANRRGTYPATEFTFLGYTFRPRTARSKDGRRFTAFLPAISKPALKKISNQVRRWRLHLRVSQSITDLARAINPLVRGWMQYYEAFHRSAMHTLLQRVNAYLLRWIRKKYKRLRGYRKAKAAWQPSPASTRGCSPTGHGSPRSEDRDDTSRMTGDGHVRNLWEPAGATPAGHPAY